MTNRSARLYLISVILILFLLASCGKKYGHTEAVSEISPDKITSKDKWAADVEAGGEIKDGWITEFNDPVLITIVDEALANNPNLKAAGARLDQARALATQADSALKPTIGLGARLSGVSGGSDEAEPEGVGIGISWEADVWGRIGLGSRAAHESAMAAEADLEFARQSLAAATAKNWFLLSEIQEQQVFLREITGLLKKMTAIIDKKEEVGMVSMQDVHQIKAQLASAKVAENRAESARQEAARGLELLLGRYPSSDMESSAVLDQDMPPVPAGVPSSVLERRPDLIAARDRVAAAFYSRKGAELLHLPRFTIAAGTGITGIRDAIAGLAGGITAPLYTGGKIEAEIAGATAAQKEAVDLYAAAALKALKEVETALSNEDMLKSREEYLEESSSELKEAYEISRKKYDTGKIGLYEVLDLQTRWVGAEISVLNIKGQRLNERIALHLALGGSFLEENDSPPPVSRADREDP